MAQDREQSPDDTGSVKRRVAGSSLSLIGANGLGVLTGVVTLRLLTTRLGTAHYGELVTVVTITSVFTLLTDIGVSAVTSRDLARRPAEASSILSLAIGFRWALCMIAIPLLWLVAFLLYPHASPAIRIGIVLLSLGLPFDATSAVLMSYFSASIRGWVTASWGTTKGLLTAAALAVVLLSGGGVVSCIIVYLCASVVANIAAVLLVRSEVTFRPRLKRGLCPRQDRRDRDVRHLPDAVRMQLHLSDADQPLWAVRSIRPRVRARAASAAAQVPRGCAARRRSRRGLGIGTGDPGVHARRRPGGRMPLPPRSLR